MPGVRKNKNVVVVGASTAGLFAAAQLARHGVAVTVLESANRLEPADRTLIVTHRMRNILGDFGEEAVVNEIRHFELFVDGRVAKFTLAEPDFVVERSTIIRRLADRAVSSGAEIRFGHRVRDILPDANGVRVVHAANGRSELVGDAVIGADGAFSSVARAAGWTPLDTVPLLQATVRMPAGLSRHTTRVWFAPDDTPYFYWLIPDSDSRAVLGLIGEDGPETKRCLERFLEREQLEPLSYQAARTPLYRGSPTFHKRLGGGDVYLVGDAASQVKVSTVGGLVTGLRGALAVVESLTTGGRSQELRSLRLELWLHLMIRRVLNRFDQSDYVRLFDRFEPSLWGSLGEYTRDDAVRMLGGLLLKRPMLFVDGLRALVSSRAKPSITS